MPDDVRTDVDLVAAELRELFAVVIAQQAAILAELRAQRDGVQICTPSISVMPELPAELLGYYGDGEFTVAEAMGDAEIEADAGDASLRRALARAGVRLGDPEAATVLGVRLRELAADGWLVRVRTNRRRATVWRVQTIPSATLGTDDV